MTALPCEMCWPATTKCSTRALTMTTRSCVSITHPASSFLHPQPSQPPPQPPPGGTQNVNDGSNCPSYSNCNSPIVINLGTGGYQLSGKTDPVVFDIGASGTPVRLAWTAAGAPMAFLALDRNGNGMIDD